MIIQYPNDILRAENKPIEKFDKGLRDLVNEMKDNMSKHIGISAPQIGVNKLVLVVKFNKYHVLINPKINYTSTSRIAYPEKCLSIPNEEVTVLRSASVNVTYQDIKGDEHTDNFVMLASVAVQHEIDHLLGKLIIDYKKEK